MERQNKYQATLRVIMICFLLASFISTSLQVVQAFPLKDTYFLKKLNKSASHDAEFPFEENEKEIENRWEDKSEEAVFLVHFHHAIQSLAHQVNLLLNLPGSPHLAGNSTGVPLYISQRSLLI